MGDSPKKRTPKQLELPLAPRPRASEPAPVERAARVPGRPQLRVVQGGGQRVHEPLKSRDAVVRVLVEAGADLLLRRISVERAEEIQRDVDKVLALFDRVDAAPELMPVLKRELDQLEALMSQTRQLRTARKGG